MSASTMQTISARVTGIASLGAIALHSLTAWATSRISPRSA
jgi:hypothetical protein